MSQELLLMQNNSVHHGDGMAADALEQASDDKGEFEKARFDYCWLVYESELKRQQQIESKIQFYLSLVTLFLGVVFFNMGSLRSMGEMFQSGDMSFVQQKLIIGTLFILAFSLVIALIGILRAYSLREVSSFHPQQFYDLLFDTTKGYLYQEKTYSLHHVNAKSLAIAIESMRGNNEERAKWLLWVQRFTIGAIFALSGLISVLVVYMLS